MRIEVAGRRYDSVSEAVNDTIEGYYFNQGERKVRNVLAGLTQLLVDKKVITASEVEDILRGVLGDY